MTIRTRLAPGRERRGVALLILLLLVASMTGGLFAAAGDTRIVRAAREGNAVALQALLRQRVDVNAAEGDGSTALLWAAYQSDLDMVRALIAARADVNAANRLGITPLLQASRTGDLPIIKTLLAAGADPNRAHPEGETPLMAAAGAGSVDGVKSLLARGAAVNVKEVWQDQTPLMWAAAEGHLDVVRVLLEAGADRDVVAKPSALPDHPGGAGRGYNDHDSRGLTAVMFAAREGHFDVAKMLASSGANLDHANPDSATALMIAIINSRFDLAAMLLEQGANANDGSLYQAVEMHNLPLVVTANDATRPRRIHENRVSALDMIGLLLDRGADPDKVFASVLHFGGQGRPPAVNTTPLQRAAQAGDVAAVRVLLAKGANPNLPFPPDPPNAFRGFGGGGGGSAGLTPLMVAIPAGSGRGGPGGGRGGPPPQFREAAERSPVETVRALLAAPGTNVNAVAPTGDTALHRAAQAGNDAIIQLLADHGATLDLKNMAGRTPLDVAMGVGAPPAGGPPGGGPGPAVVVGPQPRAVVLLRQLMGLPPLPPDAFPAPANRPGPGN